MSTLLNIVLPVFAIIFAGYASRHFSLLGEASAEALNRFVYYIALPPLLFLSTARMPLEVILHWPFIGAYLGGALLTAVVAIAGGRLLFGLRDTATLGVLGFATTFSNTAYMGIPLFIAAFGAEGATPAVVATLAGSIALIAPAVAVIEMGRSGHRATAPRVGRAVARVLLRNPIMLSLFAGVAAAWLQLPIPVPAETFLQLLGAAAAPSALFALGLSLHGHPVHCGAREVGWLVLMKLLVYPLATWWLASAVFDLEPFWRDAAVLLAALPAGALVFVIAQRYDVYVQRASAAIVVSTIASMLTLSFLLARAAGPGG